MNDKESIPKVWWKWLLRCLLSLICVKAILFLGWHIDYLEYSSITKGK